MNALSDVVERTLPPSPTSVAAARAFALDFAGVEDPTVRDRLELLVSELATNAVLHARSRFVVRVLRRGDALRVEVADRSPLLPRRKDYGVTAPTGRGIRLVEMLSDRWGAEATKEGKIVWFELRTEG